MSFIRDCRYVKELEDVIKRLETANDGLMEVVEHQIDKRKNDREYITHLEQELARLTDITKMIVAEVWFDKEAEEYKRLFRLTTFECHEPDEFKRLEYLVERGIIKPTGDKPWEEAEVKG